MAKEERLPAVYNHPSMAKHILVGHATKTKYGFLANGRLIPGGVYPADVRTRPELYVCANCGNQFVVADDRVYCGSCSIGQVTALKTGRTTKSIRDIQPLPPPPDITQPKPSSESLAHIDADVPRWDHICKLLAENNFMTVSDIEDIGYDGLIVIPGIGDKTANAIMEAFDL